MQRAALAPSSGHPGSTATGSGGTLPLPRGAGVKLPKGQPVDASVLAAVAAAVRDSGVPVLINTGFRASQAAALLRHGDGAVVGSSLKVDGVTWNPVDPKRVRELMAAVAAAAG